MLEICPSHAAIDAKQMTVGSCSFQAQGLKFFDANFYTPGPRGMRLARASNETGKSKM